MSRGTFGFRNINGKAIKLTVTKKISDKVMTKDAPKRLQRKVISAMNRAGRKARNRAKNPDWTPTVSGALSDSIGWENAKISQRGNIVRGVLVATVDYARRQEFEHKTLPFFLFRAVTRVAQPALVAELNKKKIYEKIFIGGVSFG